MKRDAAGGFLSSRSYPRALLSILFSSLSLLSTSPSRASTLSLSFSLSLLALIRRNFHRKFSLQRRSLQHRRQRREPAGSKCSVVFISTPNEFAERSALVRPLARSFARSRTYARTSCALIVLPRDAFGSMVRRMARQGRPQWTAGWLREIQNTESLSSRLSRAKEIGVCISVCAYIYIICTRDGCLFGIFTALLRFSFFRESRRRLHRAS